MRRDSRRYAVLNARFNLYAHVYFHRTTRALDLQLQEIFSDTMEILFPANPLDDLSGYLALDEWTLFSHVRDWHLSADPRKRRLGKAWSRLYNREVKWKMAYSVELSIDRIQKGVKLSSAAAYEHMIRDHLPDHLRRVAFRVDLATQDPRPINPVIQTDKSINVYNPATGCISREPLIDIYRYIPARVVHFRIFALNHDHDAELARAAERALGEFQDIHTTNV